MNAGHPFEQGIQALAQQAGGVLADNMLQEEAWIQVIQRMEAMYAELVRHQVELEEKNSALENSNRFIDNVLAAMSDVLVVADIHGRIQRVNPALEALAGKPASELLGQDIAVLFAPEVQQSIREFPQQLRDHTILDCEMPMLNGKGENVPIAINCSSRYEADGRLSGMVITGREVGELRRAYEELKQTHKRLQEAQQQLIQTEKMASLGRLVAGVAHELNNPISFVFGNMHVLRRYQDRLMRYLEAVHGGVDQTELYRLRQQLKIDRLMNDFEPLIEGSLEGAERVSQIVQNLRRFSAPNDHRASRFDLVRLLHNAVGWVVKTAGADSLQVQYDLPEQLPCHGLEGHVHQIIINLVQNAIDAMERTPEPRLWVSAEQDGGQFRIHIRDCGPGIAESHLLRVFDPFFTTKEVGKGTGLGLYISYGLAREQCGGDLRVRNHPDGGAEFTLLLPRSFGQEEAEDECDE